MKIIGYIRTTLVASNAMDQQHALASYGCTEFFYETFDVSPTIDEAVETFKAGSLLVVESFIHLGKSARQLVCFLDKLSEANIYFVSLHEKIDTREAQGQRYVQWLRQIVFTDSELLKERTLIGLQQARKQGKVGGRPKISTETVEQIRFLFFEKKEPIQKIADTCHVSLGTCYKYINTAQ